MLIIKIDCLEGLLSRTLQPPASPKSQDRSFPYQRYPAQSRFFVTQICCMIKTSAFHNFIIMPHQSPFYAIEASFILPQIESLQKRKE